ncbi:MAG TPA: glycosyltransferase [Myxococcota bacterium]|nr:glycosyltransferase [Myxococcota bacterium]
MSLPEARSSAAASPEVSVLLPVRDGEATLRGALASTLASVGPSFEIVCVDDGSRDGTGALLADMARRDARVRVLSRPARGIAAALNDALAAARGRLVARMDADDEMHPERLAEQAALLDCRPDVGLASCLVESFRAGGLRDGFRLYTEWLNACVSPDEIAREAFVDCPVPHPTWMLRRATLESVGGWRDLDWAEDLDLFYRLLAAGQRAAKLPRVLHRWRDHDRRLSRVDPRYGRDALARAKAHWLPKLRPMSAAVFLGTGRTARRYSRLLAAEGVATRALVAPEEPTSACTWHDIPVVGPGALASRVPEWRCAGSILLGAAAIRGARERIRGILCGLALVEGRDFLMLA